MKYKCCIEYVNDVTFATKGGSNPQPPRGYDTDPFLCIDE